MVSNRQNQTILIIDDNPTNLGILTEYLEKYGFTVFVARDGETGLEKAQYAAPDMILLDVMMPGIDGFETCRCLKSDEITQDIPVIFMTALTDTKHKITGFEVGAVDYITKPIHQAEVLARIASHLRFRKLTHELQTKNEILAKRADQLEISNQVGQQMTSILDLDKLLVEVVRAIQAKFGYYFVGVWLFIKQQETIVLQAGTGCQRRQYFEPGSSIPLDTAKSIVVSVYRTGQLYLANDVKVDSTYLAMKELPQTRSELALPLRIGHKVIGVLDIQSNQMAAFEAEDKTVLQTLANQVAIAIRNAQLYEKRKQLQRREREKSQELARLNADKDKFFSIVAHDLKGPFLPLLGNAELLAGTATNLSAAEIEKMSASIHRSAKRILDLLQNLLQWSRMQSGHMEYRPKRVDLKELIEQNVALLIAQARVKSISLQNKVNNNIWVYADENMVAAIIRNLISNGLKFTPKGGMVTISAYSNGKFTEVSVSDTGVGMSREDVNKLFKIDVHHTTPGTANEKGTGLGLITCQEMVQRQGGQIWLESEPGQGTTVKCTVPVSNTQT